MFDNKIATHSLKTLSFGTYTTKEVKSLSVKEVTNPQAFDALGHPVYGGPYDPALGPNDRDDVCATCGLGTVHCPGHMGHVALPLPVYNPVFFGTMLKILRGTCFYCCRLVIRPESAHLLECQLSLLDRGLISATYQLEEVHHELLTQGIAKGTQEMKQHLDEHVRDFIADAGDDENRSGAHVKHVVECRQNLVKEFISGKYFTGNVCLHCEMKTAKYLRSEHNTKVFFHTQGRQKAADIHKVKPAQPSIKRHSEVEGDLEMDQVDMDEEQEGNKENKAPTEVEVVKSGQMYLTPLEARSHLRKVFNADGKVLGKILGALNITTDDAEMCPTDMFFLEVLPVPPNRFRPVSVMGDQRFENAQTANLSLVVTDILAIKEILTSIREKDSPSKEGTAEPGKEEAPQTDLDKSKVTEKLQAIWLKLQGHVNCIIDSELDKLNSDKNPGIRQILEKKEGLFRKHMMGKRVNYAARSVISPDPYINTNEIGIPDVFAKKLTYPQPVTPWNFQQLKQAVINGPNIHPGAVLVENEDGSRTLLSAKNKTQREAVAKQLLTPSTTHGLCLGSKKVYRHLKNGDVLLLNRQPTLHRPSIQAHKARVLHGEKTLRLHYANCKAYNADFDGDEMNAHFPQNELARAEAYNIASTDFQYLVPKDGTPLAGLIQDHMVSGVMLTIRGRFFNRRDYQQLVYSALSDRNGPVIQLPPTLLKPQILWSGKQVFSTVLLNVIPTDKPALNLTGKTKISGKAWLKVKPRYPVSQIEGDDMSESQVVIRGGQLLVGVLDKGHYGPTPYGLVHSCYELYGGEVAGRLLTCLARLFTSFLQLRGFTLGVEDILVKSKADKHRSNCIRFSRGSGASVAASALGVKDFSDQEHLKDRLEEAHFNKDDGEMKDLDLSMKGHTDELQNEIVRHCMPLGLHKQFPDNNLQLMVQSGAKGSTVNCMQISCLLGQIELEGRRPPLMMSGASLPSFLPYDMTPRAGGFVDGRFLTGIRPQEYFFHCMAGREGLVDTAVKTSRSGYLQRCIIKHLEGLTVGYDLTVRDSDSSVIQFQYGEDGLDVTKTQYLKSSQFPFLVDNKGVTVRKSHLKQVQKHTDCEAAPALWKKIKKWKKKSKKRQSDLRRSPFLLFSQKNFASVAEEFPNNTITPSTGRSSASSHLVDMWKNTEVKAKHKLCKKCPDPVASRLLPSNNLGAVTERLDDVIEKYLKEDPDKLFTSENHSCKISEDKFRSLVYMRSMRSLCEPGEAVGLLAAQSIGEPSTQMTLNTFHFAGRGEMNVTLGIPRLREILMVASTSIKTPMMDVPLKDSPQAREQGEKLRLTLNKVHLDQVLEDVQLCEKVSVKKRGGERCRLYCIRFQFLPKSVYESEYCLTPQRILGYMEKSFIVTLCDVVKKWLAELQKAKLMTSGTVRPAFGTSNRTGRPAANQEENDVSDDDLHDDDATATRNRERQQQELDGGEDDEKKEIGEQEEMQDSEEEDEVVDEAADEETQEMTYTLDDATPSGGKKHRRRSKQTMDDKRVQNVLLKSSMVQDYKYDPDEELWCEVTLQLSLSAPRVDMATLVEDAARKALVYQTPGIKRGMLNESRKLGEEGKLRLRTEGINIQEIYKYSDILDLSKLYTNDIHVMANTYGIEAAARVIVQEIRDVFAAYGITVDPHHLSLVSDYMTFEGKYKPFNRVGIESNASPLQKMSFETTMHFLRNATITGASDDLKSPSSRLVVGRLVKGGTGAFELRQPFM